MFPHSNSDKPSNLATFCRLSKFFSYPFFDPYTLRYPLLLSITVFKHWGKATCVSPLASTDTAISRMCPSLSGLQLKQETQDIVYLFFLLYGDVLCTPTIYKRKNKQTNKLSKSKQTMFSKVDLDTPFVYIYIYIWFYPRDVG